MIKKMVEMHRNPIYSATAVHVSNIIEDHGLVCRPCSSFADIIKISVLKSDATRLPDDMLV